MPLAEQEKFAELMARMQDNQKTIEDDLKRVCDTSDTLILQNLMNCDALNIVNRLFRPVSC